jgi:hypothetical protein
MAAGLLLAVLGQSKAVSALLICLIAVFISYISTLGLYIVYIWEKYNLKLLKLLDWIITIVIGFLFGYKFVSLFHYSILAFLIYFVIWFVYIRYRTMVFKNAGRGQSSRLR